jgi:uncharacterized protein (DUF2252 family)
MLEAESDLSMPGKSTRREVPRSRHGECPTVSRDPVAVLGKQDESRVQDLVPIRYGRMLASSFTFYRGAAALMATDLAETPSTGIEAQLCGDAHLSNFGVYAAPDRRLVFDCNDFDETSRGPFEWDVKRLAASLAIAGRARGFGRRERREAVISGAAAYRSAMRTFAAMRNIDVWYARIDVESRLDELRQEVEPGRLKKVERNLARARSKDSLRALRKLAEEADGTLRIVSQPPLIVPLRELSDGPDAEALLRSVLAAYRGSLGDHLQRLVTSYRYLDAAHKVVGVGSVGTRAWVVLLLGRDGSDPLFLQAKEAQRSVLEPFAGASPYEHPGRRVVEGQRLMQAASDVFLGWVTAQGLDGKERHYYVRQLWDGKGSADVDRMSARELSIYASLCGEALARAHSRSGDRFAIAAYLGRGDSFDEAMARFAESYADQNERDYERVAAAAANGEIEARGDA